MRLTFEYTQNIGQGLSPQGVHMLDNGIRVIYLSAEGLVKGKEAYPTLGIYNPLAFKEKGRMAADLGVSKPSLKKVAHYGAYGFWSASLIHKFIMYSLPIDISHTLENGNISYSKDSPVSQLSIGFQNANNELAHSNKIIVAPNTKLELFFSMGSGEEITIGTFYIDRTSVSNPDGDISVTARNVIGKLLKEQTFDEDNSFTAATLQENLVAILTLAEVENFFVSDSQKNWKLTFKPEMNLLGGIEQIISLIPQWQIRENTDGNIGIGAITDGRFEQPSTYIFERDTTCWSYNTEYDDEQTYSKICITCKEPTNTIFIDLPPHKCWVSPKNKTMYIDVPDGTSAADMLSLANELSELIAITGKTETFAGIFTPQLIIGDIIELVEADGKHSVIGTVTSVRHNIGKGGFYTEFTVDSGGRKGKPLLKDFVGQISGNKKTNGGVIS